RADSFLVYASRNSPGHRPDRALESSIHELDLRHAGDSPLRICRAVRGAWRSNHLGRILTTAGIARRGGGDRGWRMVPARLWNPRAAPSAGDARGLGRHVHFLLTGPEPSPVTRAAGW